LGAGVTNRHQFVFSDEPQPSFLDSLTGTQRNDNTTSASGNLSLSYDLYTSGQRSASIRAAEEQLRFQQLDLERAREELRLNVANDYYQLQGADENVRIQRSSVNNAQASLRDAQALEQAGVGTRFAVLQAQVQLAQATQRLTDALSQQRIARRQIAARLNLPEPIVVTAGDPVAVGGLWNFSLEDSIVLAYRNRAELEQQLAQRNISEQQRRIALSELGPQISLAAQYNLSDTFDDGTNFQDEYSLAGNLRLSLFDGGAARARARQEEANIAIAETNFAGQRNQIRFEVEQAFSNLQSNLENIQTTSVALEQSREALRLARLRFQAGVGTQTEVIDAEDDLTQAEGDRVNAILNYNRALAQIQRSIGSGQQR
jgi:OMF family outer membrane factor